MLSVLTNWRLQEFKCLELHLMHSSFKKWHLFFISSVKLCFHAVPGMFLMEMSQGSLGTMGWGHRKGTLAIFICIFIDASSTFVNPWPCFLQHRESSAVLGQRTNWTNILFSTVDYQPSLWSPQEERHLSCLCYPVTGIQMYIAIETDNI